jgi:hypothetical protein
MHAARTGYHDLRWATLLLTVAHVGWLGLAAANGAGNQDTMAMQSTQIVTENFRGWRNTYRIANGLVEARIVTAIGPRIMDFHAAGGRNLLYVRDAEAGGAGESKWVQRGGWRLWIAPERTETTYVPDNVPCRAEVVNDTTVRVIGPPQAAAGIQKTVEVTLRPGESRLRLVAHIKNIADHDLTYAAWSLPVLRPGGRAFVPFDVGPLTAFDAVRRLSLWSYTKFADPRYDFGDRLIQIDQSKVPPAPQGQVGRRADESKIGVDSAQGWAAYLLDGTLFLKRFPHEPRAQYPDGGATIEVYSSHEFLELEDLGPLTTIKPGEDIALSEDWWLFAGVSIPVTEAGALSLLQGYLGRTSGEW